MSGDGFVTKDSGEREQFASGMQRDTEAGKPRFDLLIPEGVPYADQLLTRFANLLSRGAEKYDARNWEQADSQAEIDRAKSSAFRHFMQWMCGERDEDHAVATMFNIMVVETIGPRVAEQIDYHAILEKIVGATPPLAHEIHITNAGDVVQIQDDINRALNRVRESGYRSGF